jgi:hypothetical protein
MTLLLLAWLATVLAAVFLAEGAEATALPGAPECPQSESPAIEMAGLDGEADELVRGCGASRSNDVIDHSVLISKSE